MNTVHVNRATWNSPDTVASRVARWIIHLARALFTSRNEQCPGELHEKQISVTVCETVFWEKKLWVPPNSKLLFLYYQTLSLRLLEKLKQPRKQTSSKWQEISLINENSLSSINGDGDHWSNWRLCNISRWKIQKERVFIFGKDPITKVSASLA
jgi:hypothetical protein